MKRRLRRAALLALGLVALVGVVGADEPMARKACLRSSLCAASTTVEFEEASDFPRGMFLEPEGSNVASIAGGSQKLNNAAVNFTGSNFLWSPSKGVFGSYFTVAVWVYPTALGSTNQVQELFSEDGDNVPGNSLYLKNVAGSLVATINIRDGIDPKSGTAISATTSGDISRNAWHLIIARARPKYDYNSSSYDGELSIMVDNGTAVTSAITKPMSAGGGRLFAGKSNTKGSENYFTGYMDQATFAGIRWTADETALYWNSGAGLQYPFVTGGNTSYSSPTSHWRFDRVTPRVVDDASGYNDAAVGGGTVTINSAGPFSYSADFSASGWVNAASLQANPGDYSPSAWLKADALVGLADGDAVTTFTDASGNGRDFTGSGTTRPLYKTGIMNGWPALLFDGTDDKMTGTSKLSDYLSTSAFTVFIVGKQTTSDATVRYLISGSSATPQVSFWTQSGNSLVTQNDDGASDTASKNGTTTTAYIGTFMHSSGSIYTGFSDTRDASLGSAASGSTGALTQTMIMGTKNQGGASLSGYIAEAIFYPTALTQTQRQGVENYLALKYGIALPYTYVPNPNQNLHTDNRAFTIEGWFKLNGILTQQGIVSNRSGNNGWEVYYNSGTGKLNFTWGNGSSTVTLADNLSPSIAGSTWYYFAARYLGGGGTDTFKLSVGAYGGSPSLATNSTTSSTLPFNADPFVFGKQDGGNFLTGSLSAITWHKGLSLSDTEVDLHYNSGSGRECCPIK